MSFRAGGKKAHTARAAPQGMLAGLKGPPISELHGLCLESLLPQRSFHRERRRVAGFLLLL